MVGRLSAQMEQSEDAAAQLTGEHSWTSWSWTMIVDRRLWRQGAGTALLWSLLVTLSARRQDLSGRAMWIGTVDEKHPGVAGCAVIGRVPSWNADHIPGTGFHPLTVALYDQPPMENIVDLIVLVAVAELAAA